MFLEGTMINDKEVVRHFGCKFNAMMPGDRANFCRLTATVSGLGLDWWQTQVKGEFARFGRKESKKDNAQFVLGIVRGSRSLTIGVNSRNQVVGMRKFVRQPLTESLVAEIDTALRTSYARQIWPKRLMLRQARGGYLPSGLKGPAPLTPIDLTLNGLLVDPTISESEMEVLTQIGIDTTLDETQKRRLVEARIGQGEFRKRVLQRAENKCEVTEVDNTDFLIASHIRAWADCENGADRLNGNNGLLLSPNLDKLFDKGVISFNDDGEMLIKPSHSELLFALVPQVLEKRNCLVKKPNVEQREFLRYHRKKYLFTEGNGAVVCGPTDT